MGAACGRVGSAMGITAETGGPARRGASCAAGRLWPTMHATSRRARSERCHLSSSACGVRAHGPPHHRTASTATKRQEGAAVPLLILATFLGSCCQTRLSTARARASCCGRATPAHRCDHVSDDPDGWWSARRHSQRRATDRVPPAPSPTRARAHASARNHGARYGSLSRLPISAAAIRRARVSIGGPPTRQHTRSSTSLPRGRRPPPRGRRPRRAPRRRARRSGGPSAPSRRGTAGSRARRRSCACPGCTG